MDADNSEHLTIQRNGVEVDLEAGGEVFTWTADHSAAGFDLTNAGAVGFDGAGATLGTTVPNIFSDAGGLTYNVPSGDLHDFTVVGASKLTISASIISINNTGLPANLTLDRTTDIVGQPVGVIQFEGDGNDYGEIEVVSTNITAGDETGTMTIAVRSNDVLSDMITLTGSVAGAASSTISFNNRAMASLINMNGNVLDNAGSVRSNDANIAAAGFMRIGNAELLSWRNNADTFDHSITFSASDTFVISITSGSDYLFSETAIQMQGNALQNCGQIEDSAANAQLDFGTVASAVNEITITNAATGTGPIIEATGVNADIDLRIRAKAQGSILFADNDGNEELLVLTQAAGAAANFVEITNSLTNTNPIIAAAGANVDIGLEFRVKAEDFMLFTNDGNEELLQLTQVAGAALNFVEITNSITAVGPTIAAAGSETDVDLNLATKGIGVINLDIGATTELNITGSIINAPNGATFQEAGVDISPIGEHDMWFDTALIEPDTAGARTTRLIGSNPNGKQVAYIPFDSGADEVAVFKVKLERNYNLGTVTAVINWTTQAEGAGDVIWGIAGVAVADGDDMAAAGTNYGTEVTVTDTQTTIDFSQDTPRTAAVTLANTPADADTVYIRIRRLGSAGGDTFANDADLLGVYLAFSTDAATAA